MSEGESDENHRPSSQEISYIYIHSVSHPLGAFTDILKLHGPTR